MNVIIIDDDNLVCTSLKIILETDPDITIAGIGHNGIEAIELYKKLQPDVVLMDIRMEKMTGLAAGEDILRLYSNAKILFLTTFADDEYIIKAFKIGAKGYILKQNFESIITSIKTVYLGQNVFGDDIVTKIPSLMKQEKIDYSQYDISDKEYEMIVLVAEGMNNKEIAAHLYLSEGTVRNQLSVILDKLCLRDRTQLAVFYYKNK